MKYTVLPVGFHTYVEPEENCRCDLTGCHVENTEEPWKAGDGWDIYFIKYFHKKFLPLGRKIPFKKGSWIGKWSKKSILHPHDKNTRDILPDENDTGKNDEESYDDTPNLNISISASQINPKKLKQTIK